MVTKAEQDIIDKLNKSHKDSLSDPTPVPEQVPQVTAENRGENVSVSPTKSEESAQKETEGKTEDKEPPEEEMGEGAKTEKTSDEAEQHAQKEEGLKSAVVDGVTTIKITAKDRGNKIDIVIKNIECIPPRAVRRILKDLAHDLKHARKKMRVSGLSLKDKTSVDPDKEKKVSSQGADGRTELRGIGDYLGDPSRDHIEPPIPEAAPKKLNAEDLSKMEGDVIAQAQESHTEAKITE